MTFSLVACCSTSGLMGVAISSSSPAVAARCAYARAGVGAVASQNVTDPRLGPLVLDAIERGISAGEAITSVMRGRSYADYRQVLAVDSKGQSATHSGANALGIWSSAKAPFAASGGNLLANADVPNAIVEAFSASNGHLGDRLLIAMKAGLAAGGEAGPVHSAGLLVVDQHSWPVADLRCDWTESCPINALSDLWAIYQPQLQDYVQRAIAPDQAPSYGVPGDD